MTGGVLTDGVASAALLDHAASGQEYLGEIALGLLGKLSDADLLAEVRALEEQQRAMQVAWHGLVAQLEQRGLANRVGATSTAALLRGVLRLSPHEASARVKAAAVLGPRVSMDGQELQPLLPAVAAAQSRGEVSVEQAKVIAQVLDLVPSTVPVERFEQAERELVAAADTFAPKQVGDVGKRILAHLDPDGVLGSDDEHQRRREFSLTALSDGSYRAHGYLTPTCGAQLFAVLDAHAAPVPAEDGTRDPRSHRQRMHDALETLSGFTLRRNELRDITGTTQLVVTMTANQLVSQTGLAETSFGQLISIPDALQLSDEASWRSSSRTPTAPFSPKEEPSAAPPEPKPWPSSSETKVAASPAATGHRTGARDTTSSPGSTTASPTSTTSPCSAATTTETSPNKGGPVRCETAYPGGPHHPGSTPPNNPNSTTASTRAESCTGPRWRMA